MPKGPKTPPGKNGGEPVSDRLCRCDLRVPRDDPTIAQVAMGKTDGGEFVYSYVNGLFAICGGRCGDDVCVPQFSYRWRLTRPTNGAQGPRLIAATANREVVDVLVPVADVVQCFTLTCVVDLKCFGKINGREVPECTCEDKETVRGRLCVKPPRDDD